MIDKLEFLLALARERHFGRAAAACGVTQPTLSAGIRALEEQLGCPLVNRAGRFVGFTPEGERTLETARRVVGEVRVLRQEIEAQKRGLAGHLRLAAVPTAMGFVERLIGPFRSRFRDVHLSVCAMTSDDLRTGLEDLSLDAGLTYVDGEPTGRLRVLSLYRERYRLITARDGPFAGREAVTMREAAGAPLALLGGTMQQRRIVERMFAAEGLSLAPCLESDTIAVLIGHVLSRRAVAILPDGLAEMAGLENALSAIPLAHSETVLPDAAPMIGLVFPARDPLPPLTQAFVAEARRLAVPPSPPGD